MKRNIGCNKVDHAISRRVFLAGSLAGSVALGTAFQPAIAKELKGGQKRVLQIFLQGGLSQLESWDPKPGTVYGGPFRSIETSVPGIRICELLPHVAKRMHLLSIIRGINLKTSSHEFGRQFMEKGRRTGDYPFLGAVVSKYLSPKDAKLPGYLHLSTRGLTNNSHSFLGKKHGQLGLNGSTPPANMNRAKSLTTEADVRRNDFRRKLNQRFSGRGGQKAFTDVYDSSFDMADKLMKQKKLFTAKPAQKDIDRYGKHDFAHKCILARELLENGATCVKVTHHGYDTHADNFNFHLEQLGEFDKTFCMLLDDLKERGMLESTLVIIHSEFGRTPKINQRYGRDHWGTALSIALGGCGINAGMVVGKTNKEGTAVVKREVHAGHLFHTYLQALGVDSTANHDLGGRIIPIGDPSVESINELLS